MLHIKDLTVSLKDNKQVILNNLSLKVEENETHIIMGKNGAGKSTLAHALLNSPYYIKTGKIFFQNEDISDLATYEIAKKRIFVSFQNPQEISGITIAKFLKTIYSIYNKTDNTVSFVSILKGLLNKLNLDKSFINRHLNEGFSGGEKKKLELLQALIIKPKLMILDEIDSGVDVEAIILVSKIIKEIQQENNSSIVFITHQTKLLKYFQIDKVHVIQDRKIIKSGDKDLINKIEQEGFNF